MSLDAQEYILILPYIFKSTLVCDQFFRNEINKSKNFFSFKTETHEAKEMA